MKIGANHDRLVRATLRQEVFTPDMLGMRTGSGSAWNRTKGKFLAGDGLELYSSSGVHMGLRCGLLSVHKTWLGYSSPIRGGEKMLPRLDAAYPITATTSGCLGMFDFCPAASLRSE